MRRMKLNEKIEGLKTFYFRPGPYMALTAGVWIYYLVATLIAGFLAARNFFDLALEREKFCFFHLVWLFLFFWLWRFSISLYPAIWESPDQPSTRKLIRSIFLFLSHPLAVAVYFLSKRLLEEFEGVFDWSDLLAILNEPWVLLILGALFLLLLRLRRNHEAAVLFGFVGYCQIYNLLPKPTGQGAADLRMLFHMMGSSDLLIFLGGNLILIVTLGWLFFLRD